MRFLISLEFAPTSIMAGRALVKREAGVLERRAGMRFSEPAPKRGGVGGAYFNSPRGGPVSPRSGSGSSGNSKSHSTILSGYSVSVLRYI
jgi:hypothetical protein